jgi:hypothetical protein
MWKRTARWTAILGLLPQLCASMPQPSDWVPARWPWPEAKSLELLADSSVNCLLLKTYSAGFVAAAAKRGLVTLAVVSPGEDAVAAARNALSAGVNGIVLQGDFPDGESAAVKQAAGDAPVIELAARSRLQLGSKAAIIGTYQGVWPGVVAMESKAGPTGATWIQTNTGFIRAVRAWGDAMLWIANEPPPKTVVTSRRYQQAIADAAMSGARWVIAFEMISRRGCTIVKSKPYVIGGRSTKSCAISNNTPSGASCANTAKWCWFRTPPRGPGLGRHPGYDCS